MSISNLFFRRDVVNLIDGVSSAMIAASKSSTIDDDYMAYYREGVSELARALRKALGFDDDAARDDGEDEATERFLHPERYRKGD